MSRPSDPRISSSKDDLLPQISNPQHIPNSNQISSPITPPSQSIAQDFTLGTGRTIFASSLLPAILSAQREIILVTCFWAPGPTLDLLSQTLKQLSARILAEAGDGSAKVDVYICLSSRSLLQKLFHTSSPHGYIYPPSTWSRKLGLPSAAELPGLNLRVKSLFFRPFSVLHSKYLIIDRDEVWMPSCNVSWEEWFECCVHLRGDVVGEVYQFWKGIWATDHPLSELCEVRARTPSTVQPGLNLQPLKHIPLPDRPIEVSVHPHQHSTSLHLSLWPLPTSPPPTPLNTTLLHLFHSAGRSITLLTPNLTCSAVYHALLSALERGLDVRVITNRRMMVLEQLLTAGSISEFWVWRLRRAYRRLARTKDSVGELRLEYFSPPSKAHAGGGDAEQGRGISSLAAKTHVKLTLVDDEIIVLGSGNMDRASWYTSQELGIMLRDRDAVGMIWREVEGGLVGCLERYF